MRTARGLVLILLIEAPLLLLRAEEPVCEVGDQRATYTIPHQDREPVLTADPHSPRWRKAPMTPVAKDCTRTVEYAQLRTEVRGFWTDSHLYLLFACPYASLNVFLPAQNGGPRDKLWDRDVVEMFLGDDWSNIRHYREFEIAPTGDWIDLAIDLDKPDNDEKWRSGWEVKTQIDEKARIWYAAAKIPLRAVSNAPVRPSTKWRANLYRIDGEGPDSQRRFLCWQPTCVVNRDPNHVPEHFGTLVFAK